MQISHIDRPPDSPRADLFKCILYWQDDTTLLIAWADNIKVARIRTRPQPSSPTPNSKRPLPPLLVELTAMFAVDCMISGIVPYPTEQAPSRHKRDGSTASAAVPSQPRLPSFLILAYHPPDTSYRDEAIADRTLQARKLAERPELQIISRAGQELSSDVLGISGYQTCGCNDYVLAAVPEDDGQDRCYVVLNPKNVVLVRPRDRKDHIEWLVGRKKYEEALEQAALMEGEDEVSVAEIGQRYIEHLVGEGAIRCCSPAHYC